MNDFTISIPTSKRDIKLKEWQEFQSILEKNKDDKGSGDFLNLKMLQIFCGVDLDMIKNIPMNQFNGILSHLDEVFSDKSNRINTFKLRGTDDVEVEFGLIPNLNDMSYGEYIDLEKYIYDYKTAHAFEKAFEEAKGGGPPLFMISPLGQSAKLKIAKGPPAISCDNMLYFNPQHKPNAEDYSNIDVALDPFPWTGVTTSFEAHLMGVPGLTLKGFNFNSRCGESINLNLGLEEFIAKSEDDYIEKALYFYQNPSILYR